MEGGRKVRETKPLTEREDRLKARKRAKGDRESRRQRNI